MSEDGEAAFLRRSLRDLKLSGDKVEGLYHAGEFGLAVFEGIEKEAAFIFRIADNAADTVLFDRVDDGGWTVPFSGVLVQFVAETAGLGDGGYGLLFQFLDFAFEHGAGLFVAAEFFLQHFDGGLVRVELKRVFLAGSDRLPHVVNSVEKTQFVAPILAKPVIIDIC